MLAEVFVSWTDHSISLEIGSVLLIFILTFAYVVAKNLTKEK